MTEVQKAILDIFKEVKKICDDNGIKYFAIGGTCIGAVRHKGYIPWDDDLDIAIPIEKFNDFFKIAKKALPPKYEIYSCSNIKHYGCVFNKIINAETTFVENTQIRYRDCYKGVFVDIMPISGVPTDLKDRKKFCKKIVLYLKLNEKLRFPQKMKTLKGFLTSLIMAILSIVLDKNYFSDKIYKLLEQYPFSSSNFTGYVWSFKLNKLIFPTKYFKDTIEMPFEDTFIQCPGMFHEYLTCQFGDYMKIPPENKREIHTGFIDLKISFKIYQNNPDLLKEKAERC